MRKEVNFDNGIIEIVRKKYEREKRNDVTKERREKFLKNKERREKK